MLRAMGLFGKKAETVDEAAEKHSEHLRSSLHDQASMQEVHVSVIASKEEAATALDEVGGFQQRVDGGQVPADQAALEIVARVEAVTKFYLSLGITDLYGPLVEPLMAWAMSAWAQEKIMNPNSTEGRAYDTVNEYYNRYAYLNTQA